MFFCSFEKVVQCALKKKKELNVKNMGLHTAASFILEPIHHKGWISMLCAVIPGTSVLTCSSHY